MWTNVQVTNNFFPSQTNVCRKRHKWVLWHKRGIFIYKNTFFSWWKFLTKIQQYYVFIYNFDNVYPYEKKNIGYNYCSFRWFQCVHIPGGGLRAGSYKCVCQKGFYFPDKNSTTKSFPGSELEQAFLNSWYKTTNFSNVEYQCLPCPRGCENCVDDTRCMAEYNVLLRGIPLGIQSFCITVTIVIGIVVLRLRKSKVNASYISDKM